MAVNETFTGQFYINVTADFDGYIRNLSELAAMPRPTGTNITVGKVPNSALADSNAIFTYANAMSLGWTDAQWTYGKIDNINSLMRHWNGGTYWPEFRRHIIWGSGHNASGNNQITSFNLNTMTWERLSNPSRYADKRKNPYLDNSPPGMHSYHNFIIDRVRKQFICPFTFYYEPTFDPVDPNPGDDAGSFAWLDLSNIVTGTANVPNDLNALEANLNSWGNCWPYAFQNNGSYGGNGSPNHTLWHEASNTWYQFGNHKPWTMSVYEDGVHGGGSYETSNILQTPGTHQQYPKTNQAACINQIDNEVWYAFHWDNKLSGSGTQDLVIGDLTNMGLNGLCDGVRVPTTGDKPTQAYYTIGAADGAGLESAEHNCSMKWDVVNQRAIFWRPLWYTRAANGDYVDIDTGLPIGSDEAKFRSLQFTEITRDKVCRNLRIVENSQYSFPQWDSTSFPVGPEYSDQQTGGPYGRFDYIEEYDVFIYVHNVYGDVFFLKFPSPL